jgi:hypothetical protein
MGCALAFDAFKGFGVSDLLRFVFLLYELPNGKHIAPK